MAREIDISLGNDRIGGDLNFDKSDDGSEPNPSRGPAKIDITGIGNKASCIIEKFIII
jgi:hypothetical protein